MNKVNSADTNNGFPRNTKHENLEQLETNLQYHSETVTLRAIADSLKNHISWTTNPKDHAYKWYGDKGRRVALELIPSSFESNQMICNKLFSVIGLKPIGYFLDVDWQSHNGLMTLNNVRWISKKQSSQMRETYSKQCPVTGQYLAVECEKKGVKNKTAASRLRKGYKFHEAINPQLCMDIDLAEQNKKFEEIACLIREGKLFADSTGRVFTIYSDGSVREHHGQMDDNGYWTMVIKSINKRVGMRHIVLIQYAGVP